MNTTTLQPAWQRDAETIGLIGLAHGTSHFFHLLLPPLFPALMSQLGLSFTQCGLLTTVFFVVSGVGQALAGFVVDRIGPLPVLLSGIGALACAGLLLGSAIALLAFVVLLLRRKTLQSESPRHSASQRVQAARAAPSGSPFAFLGSSAVWMCFVFSCSAWGPLRCCRTSRRRYSATCTASDTGMALIPVLSGGLLDAGLFRAALAGIAVLQVGALLSAIGVGNQASASACATRGA